MRGPTHCLIGITSGAALALALQLPPLEAGACAAVGAVSALLPDLDTGGSIAGRRSGPVGWLFRLFVNHRGSTHSLLLPVLLFIPLIYAPHSLQREIIAAIITGYLSHLAADALTLSGVPLLWPWPRHLHLLPPGLRLRTGGLIERAFFVLLLPALALIVLAILGWWPMVADLLRRVLS